MDKKVTVISLGGSIIAPNSIDVSFLKDFVKEIKKYLTEDKNRALIIVCGGGALAREYQSASKQINNNINSDIADWIGIRATHLNAELLRSLFLELASEEVITNPTMEGITFNSQVLLAGGWKPGFSTDTDAVLLAKRFNAETVINLSNIKKVYTDDPKKNPEAKPIDKISWENFLKITGTEWIPGKNTPFDPVASKLAMDSNIRVICADGRDIKNTINILNNSDFIGTIIY